WHLAFPEVMQRGGFDVVLGNPPWEVSQLNEVEYFATRVPSIARLDGEQRKRAIRALETENPVLWNAFRWEKRKLEAETLYARAAGRFCLTTKGKINSYALFAELALSIVNTAGRVGLIVPTGIATDDTNKAYFDEITQSRRLVSLFDFRNKGFFPGAASAQGNRFCLLTLVGGSGTAVPPEFAFRLEAIEQLSDSERRFSLSSEDFALLNPNTRTCPVFRSKVDAELTKKVYYRVPVLVNEKIANGNPWCVTHRQGLFNMTTGSSFFKTAKE